MSLNSAARTSQLLVAETLALTVAAAGSRRRLDQFLARQLGWSRARLQKLLKSGRVLVNGEMRPASYRVRAGDAVLVCGAGALAQPPRPRSPAPGDPL